MPLHAVQAVFFDAVGTILHPVPSVSEAYWQVGKEFGSDLSLDEVKAKIKTAFANQEARFDRDCHRTCEKAAQAGDPLARKVLQEGIDALGFGLAQVMAIACPKRLVVGGGVSLLGEENYLEPLRESVRRQTFAPYANLVDLVGAELGEEVVLHGAIALAMLGRFQAG